MSDEALLQRAIAIELSTMFPPMVRESLLESSEFRHKFDIQLDAEISFGDTGLKFRRSVFYKAVRQLYERSSTVVSIDRSDGAACALKFEVRDDKEVLAVEDHGNTIILPPFAMLSPDGGVRLNEFEREVAANNLFGDEITRWRDVIQKAPLSDDEVDEVYDEFRRTPVFVAQAIRNDILGGTTEPSALVPRSFAYYERLIGPLASARTIEEFERQFTAHLIRLLNWDFKRGFAQCLLSCARPSLSALVRLERFDSQSVEEVFNWLAVRGGRFSQIAGFEIGMRAVPQFPQLVAPLTKMATQVRDDDPADTRGRLRLTSSLVVFVDGELSRIACMRGVPPFWRRLAAIAQASLIERELLRANVEVAEFSTWAVSARSQSFYMQTFADLRREPRWLPDFVNADRLKYEFVSRALIVGDEQEDRISSTELKALVSRDVPEGLSAQIPHPLLGVMPGPLEGGTIPPSDLPPAIVQDLRSPTGETVPATFFAGLVNSAFVYRIERDHAVLAAEALRKVGYRLRLDPETDITFSVLAGLAMAAATSRSKELAEAVRVLCRVLRKRPDVTIEPDAQMRIGLIAAAANSDLNDWAEAVGQWFTELSYENIDDETASTIQRHLKELCRIVPELWRSCGKADAAFAAVAQRASIIG